MTFEEAVKNTDLQSLGYAYTSSQTHETELIPAKVGMILVISRGNLFHDFEVRHDSRGFLAMVSRTVGHRKQEVLYREVFVEFDDALAAVQSRLDDFFHGRFIR